MKSEHGGDLYHLAHRDILDFSVNTNPLGMPPKVQRALVRAVDDADRYPDIHHRALVGALAGYHNIAPEMILPGPGAADLIYRFAYAVRPAEALIPAPTFSEYERAVEQAGGIARFYYLKRQGGFRLDARICSDITPDTEAIFLCNPNNPTGGVMDLDLVEYIVKSALGANAYVFLDECFIDFVGDVPTAAHLLDTYPNLIILRAFTKNYAMAGVRIGYVLSSNLRLLERMRIAGPPWQVSCFAGAGAIAAVACTGHLDMTRAFLEEERPFLSTELERLGFTVFPSRANYLLFDAHMPDLKEKLLMRDVFIRSCASFRGLSRTFCRVAVKKRADNLTLIEACTAVLDR